ncbi:MFS transporter [Alicyclobacillus ferrooxydans]|uniref:Major facilitator superfamily (MFS) profile domain-containing protein n=1 Tax=Alicyclobacillus ferrooxydans TaxID=471514 RepID=A0A0P9CL27_9BACL|nr:MFS transporter [Alicyclobacillus ferrooxydans]KPV43712.1 hypothetical protein AN477_11180 [Alicyclobacillus ferrooxydans]
MENSDRNLIEDHRETSRWTRRGRRNLFALYGFTASSRLWFDGSLWLLYWQHRGISLFEVGILEAILHLVCLLVDVPIGVFADRYGWKLSLFLSGAFGVLYCGVSLAGSNFWWGAAAFAVRGVQVTLTNGSDTAIAYESARIAGLTERYQAISGRLMAVSLIAMALAESAGGALATVTWNAVYIAFAVSNAVSMVVVLYMQEPRTASPMYGEKRELAQLGEFSYAEGVEGVVPDSVLTIARDAVRFAKTSPLFLKWILFSATLSGFLATFSFYGQSLLIHNGWSLLGMGILSGFENGFGAAMALLSDTITRVSGSRRTTWMTAVLGGLGLTLFAFVPGLSSGKGYLIGSAAGNLADPLIDKELNHLVPSRQRATLLSANSTSFSLFMVIVFPLFGLLASRVGLTRAAEVGSLVGVSAIGLASLWLGQSSSTQLAGSQE